jgi:WS/DGAT/MGAT family acyltransferase
MKIVLDQTPSPRAPARKPRFRPAPHSASSRSIVDSLAGALRGSIESLIAAETVLLDFSKTLVDDKTRDALEKLVALLPEITASSERFVFNKPCSGERKFCCTEFSLPEVQAIRAAAGGTVNDVILTVVTRAVSKYLREHGDPVAGRFLRVVCPVNMRQDKGETLGNRITFLPVVLPLDIQSPLSLLQAVAQRTEIMKNAHAAHAVALLGMWIGAAPPPLQALFWSALPQVPLPVALFHMICTNVPGSPTPLFAGGRRMVGFYPHVPTGYELGVNCAFQSYDDRFFCGLTADANVVPDAGRLRDLVKQSFAELRRAAVRGRTARAPSVKATAAEATPPMPMAAAVRVSA